MEKAARNEVPEAMARAAARWWAERLVVVRSFEGGNMEKAARNEVPEAMARAAARWWAKRADGTARHNNRSGDLASTIAGLLADKMNEAPQAGALEKFEEILAEKIMTYKRYYWDHIWVDYGPDHILAESAKEAGITCANFPWKTGMIIDPEKGLVMVRLSMGPWETIWEDGHDKAD